MRQHLVVNLILSYQRKVETVVLYHNHNSHFAPSCRKVAILIYTIRSIRPQFPALSVSCSVPAKSSFAGLLWFFGCTHKAAPLLSRLLPQRTKDIEDRRPPPVIPALPSVTFPSHIFSGTVFFQAVRKDNWKYPIFFKAFQTGHAIFLIFFTLIAFSASGLIPFQINLPGHFHNGSVSHPQHIGLSLFRALTTHKASPFPRTVPSDILLLIHGKEVLSLSSSVSAP